MAKKTEDVIAEEVRRRVAEILSAGGVDYGRTSLESLYLLPTEFVRMYTDLFWQALREDFSKSNIGGSDEGRVVKKVKKEGTGAREMHISGSGGKRFKQFWSIRDERAAKIKTALDRKLVRAAEAALRDLSKAREHGVVGAAGAAENSVPDTRKSSEHSSQKRKKTRCPVCGKIQSDEWTRCPFHE